MAIENRSTGFGDDIEKVAKRLGLDKVAQNLANTIGAKDCGCGARKETLNDPNLLINKVFYKKKEENE
jgi:hypothetical protein